MSDAQTLLTGPSGGHAELHEIETVCRRTFTVDERDRLTVTTRSTRHAGPRTRWYKVIIERDPPTSGTPLPRRPISLCNIGVQARRWHVAVRKIVGTNVVLTRHEGAKTIVLPTGDVKMNKRLRRIQPNGTGSKNPGLVWLLQFDGERCELEIASWRPCAKVIGPSLNHDTFPPPPEGGGDEEEEGGSDEEGGDDGGE